MNQLRLNLLLQGRCGRGCSAGVVAGQPLGWVGCGMCGLEESFGIGAVGMERGKFLNYSGTVGGVCDAKPF